MRKLYLALGFSLCLSLVFMVPASAQEPLPAPSDDQVNAIAKQLYCPVCENTPLDVCPTTACAQWRELIRQELAAGKSEQQIKDLFVNQYGARVLGTPPPRGINLLVYILPVLAVAVGVYILYRVYRSWRRPLVSGNAKSSGSETPPVTNSSQDEYIRRLEEEVRKG